MLPIARGVTSGRNALFGGAGLAAAITAMEGTSGRPLVWATAQYLSFAESGGILDLDVTLAVVGHNTTQARAVGHVGGTEIITVNAALGSRSIEATTEFVEAPDVNEPDQSPPRISQHTPSGIGTRMEQRWALPAGTSGDGPTLLAPGRVALWMRIPDLTDTCAATLAVIGDFVPMALSVTVGQRLSSSSIDNTLRVVQLEPSEWFLLDIQTVGVRNGFGHGHVNIFSERRTLLAVASQSVIVRERR